MEIGGVIMPGRADYGDVKNDLINSIMPDIKKVAEEQARKAVNEAESGAEQAVAQEVAKAKPKLEQKVQKEIKKLFHINIGKTEFQINTPKNTDNLFKEIEGLYNKISQKTQRLLQNSTTSANTVLSSLAQKPLDQQRVVYEQNYQRSYATLYQMQKHPTGNGLEYGETIYKYNKALQTLIASETRLLEIDKELAKTGQTVENASVKPDKIHLQNLQRISDAWQNRLVSQLYADFEKELVSYAEEGKQIKKPI